MSKANLCLLPRAGPQTKPQWAAGRVLTAEACSLEQQYRLQKLRRHNREMHAWGVLCGLWVVPAVDSSHPWGVRICPGYAIGPYGDEIELLQSEQVNIEDYLWYQPHTFSAVALRAIAYIAVRYQDWSAGLATLPSEPCECANPEYKDAYIVDGHQAGVLWTGPKRRDETPTPQPTRPPSTNLPATGEPKGRGEMCRPESPHCPPCPDSPWVILARVLLPARGVPLTAAMIDNGFRDSW